MNNHARSTFLLCCTFLLTACGGGSSSSDTTTPTGTSQTSLTLGISDAPVDDADAVVVTIDTITFKRDGNDDVVFDTFNNSELGIENADTVQIDLLQYQGSAQINILEGEMIDVGDYNQVIVGILDDDIEATYLLEKDGDIKAIKLPSDTLKLGGVSFSEGNDTTALTIEFNLRRSMTYNTGPDRYILKPTGVRVVDNSESGTISGVVALDTINQSGVDCMADNNMIYLYEGTDLDTSLLADNFDSEEANHGAPDNAIAPIDSTSPSFDDDSQTYQYEFGFVPSGQYTLVYACNSGEEGDDPEKYDGDITLPNPETEVITVTVENEAVATQDFPITQ
ncbi:DUF4382 domain-containing protein [Thalassotalea sp. G2M2-11]|uniref:DUF4382 domain-containing protein n=1 Tax=Thalassotalea sp. G2M2-11 TaxID=2787627 RepID=UPI0019D094B8|nr:DUF4382 domain-containing protein [Thalassotalea sp. G2M2-11]